MGEKFLGVPLFVWAILCLTLAAVWVFVWPGDRAEGAGHVRHLILRWFHALTWLLLAVAAFVAGLDAAGHARLAKGLTLSSLAVYLLFMVTFLTSRPRG